MFLDWLVDRRHCSLKWQNAVMAVREKINAALQDMPENDEIKQLLRGSCQSLSGLIDSNLICLCICFRMSYMYSVISYATGWVKEKTPNQYENLITGCVMGIGFELILI